MMEFAVSALRASWELLLQASPYILFGLLVGGLLRVYLSPAYVANHLGGGRFSSVFKAALLGIPIPLCSCGVLPAAASLQKQGANNGATTAFLISTPESGVDSISITWALLDPIMTVARPLAAFLSAITAGVSVNLLERSPIGETVRADLFCPIDNCCDGSDCLPEEHRNHHGFMEKCYAGIRFAATDLWGELAGWFFVGILLAGMVTVLVPDKLIGGYLGGGISSMLLMLAIGIPLYICATASTPIAAALILKGVSPGTALVFLLAGPATNVTSLSMLVGLLGKRATALYLISIGVVAVVCGLLVDFVYMSLGISAVAVIGTAAEFLPRGVEPAAALLLLALSVRPLMATGRSWFGGQPAGCCCPGDSHQPDDMHEPVTAKADCGCGCCGSSDLVQMPVDNRRASSR